MIIPSRWFSGGKGLDDFRDNMLSDNRLSYLVDFFDSTECFPGVDLSGGVCYFLWADNHCGDCNITNKLRGEEIKMKRPLLENGNDTFIRFNSAVSIIRKIRAIDNSSIVDIISSRKPFGIDPKVKIVKGQFDGSVKVYAYPDNGYISRSQITQNGEWIDEYKVMIAKAYGERGDFPYLMIGKPFVAERGSCCTETYLVIGPFGNRKICENVISYVRTKFFRFLVLQKKNTQNAAKGVYEFVPLQDFSKPWTDEELYKKYGLTDEEIQFIESMIRPME
jgi:site-specific DNA-methyltransferase (adenine-specific)